MDHIPSVSPKKLIRLLGKVGFVIDHYRGSHAYLKHKESGLRTCIPIHHKDLQRGFLKTILKQVSIIEEDFKNLL